MYFLKNTRGFRLGFVLEVFIMYFPRLPKSTPVLKPLAEIPLVSFNKNQKAAARACHDFANASCLE